MKGDVISDSSHQYQLGYIKGIDSEKQLLEQKLKQFQLLYGRFDSDTGDLIDYKTNEYGEHPVNLLIKYLKKDNL